MGQAVDAGVRGLQYTHLDGGDARDTTSSDEEAEERVELSEWSESRAYELAEYIDTLDDMDVEDETEEKVQQVLDEICGETSAQAATASVPINRVQRNRQTADEAGEDEAVEEMLAAMRAPGKA